MIKRLALVLFFIFATVSHSFAESDNDSKLSAKLSEKAFYSNSDQIISQFEKKSENCQRNFILAKAYRNKKELKKALLYYANSCFNKKYNFNLRLFPQPVYSFIEQSKGRSIFYQDSLYEIASIFYKYGEHEYVLKFTELIDNDGSAIYRESVILKSKSLEKMNRFNQAIDNLQDISSSYRDSNSQALIYLRMGAIYESAGEFFKAADSYINMIKSDSSVWQNGVAAKRLTFLTNNKKVKLDSTEKSIYFASALYDAGDYNKAILIADEILQKENSPVVEKIKLRILTKKNYAKAVVFLKEREKNQGYNELLLEHANIIWDKLNKNAAVKIYCKLSSISDTQISEKVLTRLSFFYEEKNKPDFIKYMELYIKKFPEKEQSGRFTWLIGRYYMKTGNKVNAIDYFNRGIKHYPDNSYTSYCRFWLHKITSADKKTDISEELLEDLAVNNPDTYHALALLKIKADKTETSLLTKQYENSRQKKNIKKMILFHTLLFIKNGYNNYNTERVKQLDSDITDQYLKISGLIKNPVYSGNYKHLLKKIELYFYAGDIDAVNREKMLIPENNDEAQKDIALALTVYSIKHKYYNYSTFYGFKLLNLYNLKENLSLFSQGFAEALYPYSFAECVNEESKNYNIKSELLLSMMKVESNFNHKAISSAGASGLMQLMPPTAKGISKKLKISKYDLIDPCISIKFGANYISWLNGYYHGQIEYMISGYNAGTGNVNKWKGRGDFKDIDQFSEFNPFDETRDYIFRIKKYLIQYETIYKKFKK